MTGPVRQAIGEGYYDPNANLQTQLKQIKESLNENQRIFTESLKDMNRLLEQYTRSNG